ncbi:MAG TPA: preprotein translocase subunit YajC [Firmicutes bacterium]|nr:preprotein translocase subunit YajC [Bacillota bacterium]
MNTWMRILDASTAVSSAVEGAEQTAPTWLALLMQFGVFIPIILIFYFLLIRPQRKRDKQMQEMRNSLQVGDEVVTSGGIIGIVVSIKEDTVVVETGSDRSKVRLKRWAIQSNETIHDED